MTAHKRPRVPKSRHGWRIIGVTDDHYIDLPKAVRGRVSVLMHRDPISRRWLPLGGGFPEGTTLAQALRLGEEAATAFNEAVP